MKAYIFFIFHLSSFLNVGYKFPLDTTLVSLEEFSYSISLLPLFHNIFKFESYFQTQEFFGRIFLNFPSKDD